MKNLINFLLEKDCSFRFFSTEDSTSGKKAITALLMDLSVANISKKDLKSICKEENLKKTMERDCADFFIFTEK